MTTLKTRTPTGRVPWPLILIEGGEKAGKSWACAELSASPKVGQTYWIDLGEGSADEYGAIPGARYLIVEHDGTFGQILAAVEAIKAEAQRAADAGEPPVVVVLDSGTAEWDLLKGIADAKARARLAKKGKRLGPDEEPQISMDLWNDINGKHRKLMTHLMTFPGIAVVTARGKDVAALDSNGRPVEGSKEYKVEGQKNLAFDATVWIRVSRDHPPLVVGARSVHAGIQPGVDRPRPVPGMTLEKVVFEILRCNPTEAHVRDLVQPQVTDADVAEGQAERPVSAPPASRPVSGPPAALSAAATGLLDDLTQATDETGLRRVWRAAVAADNEGRVSKAEAEHFQAQWKARKAELFPPEPKNPGNDPQRRKMFALLGQADITDRDDRLAYVSDIAGRPVGSTNDLTDDEVQAVVARLESYIAQNTPPAEDLGAAS
ncbi:hypothetical protein E1193_11755 [Micromonospora sp. KC606]|uniref:hypothetical protein n=1 Tax=Micromonospora sp. KC606 TaxID=2530379 RepID=UPI00104BC5FC|nr:hypothetical protein [Micromonospora sp. KC606]TDC82418.1 hypothetical protein E1193_11755 [Micromonospora sp. KC606]